MSGIDRTEGVNPNYNIQGHKFPAKSPKAPKLYFGFDKFYRSIETRHPGSDLSQRLSPETYNQFLNLKSNYKDVAFLDYHEDIAPLVIGEDFIEDAGYSDKCEV